MASQSEQVIYVVVRNIEYEGGSIKGVFLNKEDAEKLEAKLNQEDNPSDVSYNIYFIKEGKEVDLSL